MRRQKKKKVTSRAETLARLDQATTEIRNVKEQQYKTAYYGILLCSAVIILYQVDVVMPANVYRILKWITMAVVALLFRQTAQIQWDHFIALYEYRQGLDQLTTRLSARRNKKSKRKRATISDYVLFIITGKRLPSAKEIVTAEDKLASCKRYTWMFIALSFVATVATEIVLYFDK